MKVILHKEVEKLGVPGDVVDVKDGYARNYLVPQGLAAPASKGSVQHAERLRKAHDERVRRALDEASSIAVKLSARPIRIPARAGEDGRLFGSVTAADLAKEIEAAAGAPVDRRQIRLDEPIRSVGAHEVVVHLHPEVNATVTVEVTAAK